LNSGSPCSNSSELSTGKLMVPKHYLLMAGLV